MTTGVVAASLFCSTCVRNASAMCRLRGGASRRESARPVSRARSATPQQPAPAAALPRSAGCQAAPRRVRNRASAALEALQRRTHAPRARVDSAQGGSARAPDVIAVGAIHKHLAAQVEEIDGAAEALGARHRVTPLLAALRAAQSQHGAACAPAHAEAASVADVFRDRARRKSVAQWPAGSGLARARPAVFGGGAQRVALLLVLLAAFVCCARR